MVSAMDTQYSPEVITLWYRPPELLQGVTIYSQEVDIWSFGCILYEMFMRRPLFTGKNIDNQLALIMLLNKTSVEKELKATGLASKKYIDIILKCLTMQPHRRITAKEIVMLLHLTPRK